MVKEKEDDGERQGEKIVVGTELFQPEVSFVHVVLAVEEKENVSS